MSIHINGRKITGLHYNGKRLNAAYRDGVKLWSNEVGSVGVKGIKVEAVDDLDRIYLNYAMAEVTEGQIDSWVDVEIGSKTFRLAGDMTSRNKALFAGDTVTWDNVKVTSDDVWVGGYVTAKVKVAALTRKSTNSSWETKNKGELSFGLTALAPETSFKLSLYNPLTTYLGQTRGIKGKLNVSMLVGDDEADGFVTKAITFGSKKSYNKSWEVSDTVHDLFTAQKVVRFNIALTGISYLGPGVNANVISLQSMLGSKDSCGLFMETEAIERTIRLKVKEIVK